MKNVGSWDRAVRIVFAIILLVVGSLSFDGFMRLALYFLALVLVVTSVIGFCPAYKLLNINTKGKNK